MKVQSKRGGQPSIEFFINLSLKLLTIDSNKVILVSKLLNAVLYCIDGMVSSDHAFAMLYQVVLIEQEPIARRRIKHGLVQAGCRVEMAKSLEKGTLLLDGGVPALILLDWDLKGSDRFLQALKERPKLANSYVICLGYRSNVTDRIQALNLGADEFLIKPIVEAELLAKVKAGLRIYQMQDELALRNQTLEAELEEATRYMRSQLPAPMQTPITIDFRFLPSQHLGGDCFDYFWISEQTLALYLLDVSGHGMGATLMAIGLLNDIRRRSHGIPLTNPAAVLTTLNQRVQMSETHRKYLTMWYGIYDVSDRTLTYASAGHPPALLMREDEGEDVFQVLKTPSIPIGLFSDSHYQNATVSVSSDNTLYLFSDGVYEFPDIQGKIWGLDAFQLFLQTAQKEQLPLDLMLTRLKDSSASRKFMDDLSLLQVRFNF